MSESDYTNKEKVDRLSKNELSTQIEAHQYYDYFKRMNEKMQMAEDFYNWLESQTDLTDEQKDILWEDETLFIKYPYSKSEQLQIIDRKRTQTISEINKNTEASKEVNKLLISDLIIENTDLQLNTKLNWQASKKSIGTLFGVLLDANLIKGSKADVIRFITGAFDNLSKSSIKDNLYFKQKDSGYKQYDEELKNALETHILPILKPKKKQ